MTVWSIHVPVSKRVWRPASSRLRDSIVLHANKLHGFTIQCMVASNRVRNAAPGVDFLTPWTLGETAKSTWHLSVGEEQDGLGAAGT